MKYLKIFISFFSILFFAFTYDNPMEDFRKIENNAFGLKEKCTFNVNYGFVTAGIASFSIPEIKTISGREAYRIKFDVNTVPSFDWMFKVRDRYESYIDVEGIFSWRFERHIREGSFSNDFTAFFDQRKQIAVTGGGKYKIPFQCHDIVSAFFYCRTLDLGKMKKGDKIHLENFYDDKVYKLDVVFHGKETITVPAGTFKCIIVEPLVLEGGLFKNEGTITIWISDDEVKLPIRVKTKVIIGAIDAELTGYEGLKSPLTSKVN